jgi:heterodisulfide reductase subunit B
MKFKYFPGCTLKTKGKELDLYARASARALGFELQELADWQCCGAVYPMAKDEIATKLSSVRALVATRDEGAELVTLCSACHNVIKQVNHDMKTDADIALRVNNYMGLDTPYHGEASVLHFLEVLRDRVGFDNLRAAVKNPLTGRKIAAYYGCLLLRPGKVMQFDDPENPTILEDFIRAIGAEPVIWGMRNECCGGYIAIENKQQATLRSSRIMENALANGADTVITACPLCLYNLKKNGKSDLPVVYFTELLATALGVN